MEVKRKLEWWEEMSKISATMLTEQTLAVVRAQKSVLAFWFPKQFGPLK